jgi:soluble lytic murein transglycosylase
MGSVRRSLRPLGLSAAVVLLGIATVAATRDVPSAGPRDPARETAGRLLRRAVDAHAAGEIDKAEPLLATLVAQHPVIADYADLLRMRIRVEGGRFDEAIAMRAGWAYEDSPLESDFFTLLGDAYAARGEEIAARSAWEFARLATSDAERLATLHLASAQSYERSGERATAAESYLRVWASYPLSPEAELAGEHLDTLESQPGLRVRSGLAWRRRGDALFRARRNEAALAAYEKALASGELSPARARRTRHQVAETLFRLRRYPEAAEAFARLPDSDDVRIAHARSLARAGQVEAGARNLEKIGSEARGSSGARAYLLAALLWDGEDETERARRLFENVVRRSPHSSYAKAALWRLGWSAYQAGRFTDALVYFEALERREEDPIAALRPRYWSARAAERDGRDGAVQSFAAIAREYPLSYYGWRARDRAREEDAPAVAPVSVRPGTTAIGDAALERPRILIEAGLLDAAREELNRLFPAARGLGDRLALAQLYADAGDFHRPQRLVVDAYLDELARGPAPAQLEIWWHAWPMPFEREVREALAGRSAPSQELLYAIMREESGYRPEVVSVSGARGLLQLMPSTAERLAADTRPGVLDPDDLFDPGLNIALGATYLEQLLGRFDGNRAAAIGSYNAGPGAVSRWLEREDGDDDEWVEAIAYEQTRAYVKRVLRSIHAYQVLY